MVPSQFCIECGGHLILTGASRRTPPCWCHRRYLAIGLRDDLEEGTLTGNEIALANVRDAADELAKPPWRAPHVIEPWWLRYTVVLAGTFVGAFIGSWLYRLFPL